MTLIDQIRDLIAEGETQRSLDELYKYVKESNADVIDNLVMLRSRMQNLQRAVSNGTMDDQSAALERAKINEAILKLLPQLTPEYLAQASQRREPNRHTVAAMPSEASAAPARDMKKIYLIAGGSLLVLVLLIAIFSGEGSDEGESGVPEGMELPVEVEQRLASNNPSELGTFADYYNTKALENDDMRGSVSDYQYAVILREKQLKLNDTEENRIAAASEYNDLAYAQFFIPDAKAAETSLRRGLELDPSNKDIPTNMALSYLLQNRWADAEAEYNKWKDIGYDPKYFPTYRDIFLSDLISLEKKGVSHPDFAKVRALLGDSQNSGGSTEPADASQQQVDETVPQEEEQ